MDQDQWQESGREELEGTVQEQIRGKEEEIRELREEIRDLRVEIRDLREERRELQEQIRAKEEEIREEIRELQAQIRAKEQEIGGVKKSISISSGTEVRVSLEANLQFLQQEIISLREDIKSRNQQIISLREDIKSRNQQIISLREEIKSRDQQINSRDQQISILRQEVSSLRSVQQAPASAEPPMTVETIKNLLASTAKPAILSLSMSSITTKVADDVLKMAGFCVVDGSTVEPAEEISVSKEWEFDMGQFAREEDCYEPFFQHMVKYLNTVHAVKIQKDPPFPREAGYCRLLDVHKLNKDLELEAELGDRMLRITGNLDAVFVPRRRGLMQYKDSLLGGVEVKHSTSHKETFKHGAPTVGIAKSGQSAVSGQALMEALAVYAYSDFPKGIFLFTSYDDNAVMELKDGEIWCWTDLNFAQAMDKIAAFLKGEDVQNFLEESEKPARSRERPHISESKRSVRKKLKIGLGNEEFLEQVDVIRSAAGSELEMISDLFQLVESWRYSRTEACGSAGPLSYFS